MQYDPFRLAVAPYVVPWLEKAVQCLVRKGFADCRTSRKLRGRRVDAHMCTRVKPKYLSKTSLSEGETISIHMTHGYASIKVVLTLFMDSGERCFPNVVVVDWAFVTSFKALPGRLGKPLRRTPRSLPLVLERSDLEFSTVVRTRWGGMIPWA